MPIALAGLKVVTAVMGRRARGKGLAAPYFPAVGAL
jgi:hypothetical protein